jgi:16S rRNA (guanine966-N2)-methyltransferase
MKQEPKRRSAMPKAATGRMQPHQVRLIGGQWKRTTLTVLAADGLRPTPDRVRETAFNWLNHLFDGDWSGLRCLDLFGGSGALGFEAASRGAAQVTLVEHSTPAVQQLEALKAKLDAQQVSIVRGDSLRVGAALAERSGPDAPRFDLIFLDPPYGQGWLGKVLPLCRRLLAKNGIVYVEAEAALGGSETPPWLEDWEIVRADHAGMVFYHLLQCKNRSEFKA